MATANISLDEFDEKHLTCDVCKGIYEDPRILSCHHSFCAKCLEKWQKEKSEFTCPTCRHHVELEGEDITSLPPNFYINNLLEFRHQHNIKRARASCGMCESEASIEGTCGDCKLLLCGNCLTGHGNSPALNNHYIITLRDLENNSSGSKFAQTQFCPQHSDHRRTFYCQPCAMLVCRECTATEHKPGPNHDPQEVSNVAQKCKADLQTLVGKTRDTAVNLKKTMATVGFELTSITEHCQTVKKEIRNHFAELRARLDQEEEEATNKVDQMEIIQKEPLLEEKKELEERIRSTEVGLQLCTDVLARGNDVEVLTLRQQLEDKLKALSSSKILHKTLEKHISFQPTFNIKCELSMTYKPLVVTDVPVESLPTTVIYRPPPDEEGEIDMMVTVTSPWGELTFLDCVINREGPAVVYEAVWRPQTVGKHILEAKEIHWMGVLCPPVSVDVGSNNPVLRFGEKGSQQGQFNYPWDVAVSGDRLYVADKINKRVQVFDLFGNFCYSFSTATFCTNPESLAIQEDGTIVVRSADEQVMKFSPLGELLQKFTMDKYCTNSCGLGVQRDGRIVVADKNKHSIFLFEANGTLVKQTGIIGMEGEGEEESYPSFVCVDKEDNIIVTDRFDCLVQVFDKDLNFQYVFGGKDGGDEPQDMCLPAALSADSKGNIVLANLGNYGVQVEKLQVFRLDGTWVSTISSTGDKPEEPMGVAVTEDGHVFVADVDHYCIRKYRYL